MFQCRSAAVDGNDTPILVLLRDGRVRQEPAIQPSRADALAVRGRAYAAGSRTMSGRREDR